VYKNKIKFKYYVKSDKMNIELYRYDHPYYLTMFLCKPIYDIICKDDRITLIELWKLTHFMLNKDEFCMYLNISSRDSNLFETTTTTINKKISKEFGSDSVVSIIADVYGSIIVNNIKTPRAYFDKHIYSITYFWMLIVSKTIFKLTHDVCLKLRKYRLSNILLDFGLLKEEEKWDDYPKYPSIQDMIAKNIMSITYCTSTTTPIIYDTFL
jgi:hypothetical protein